MQRARRRARRLSLVTLLLAVTPAAGFGGSAAPHLSGRTCGAQRLRSRRTRLAIDQLLDGGWSNAEIARAFTQSDKDGTGKLSDEEVRQGLKKYSNWPTYPQLYGEGKLIGGLDIMKELVEEDELASSLPASAKQS